MRLLIFHRIDLSFILDLHAYDVSGRLASILRYAYIMVAISLHTLPLREFPGLSHSHLEGSSHHIDEVEVLDHNLDSLSM